MYLTKITILQTKLDINKAYTVYKQVFPIAWEYSQVFQIISCTELIKLVYIIFGLIRVDINIVLHLCELEQEISRFSETFIMDRRNTDCNNKRPYSHFCIKHSKKKLYHKIITPSSFVRPIRCMFYALNSPAFIDSWCTRVVHRQRLYIRETRSHLRQIAIYQLIEHKVSIATVLFLTQWRVILHDSYDNQTAYFLLVSKQIPLRWFSY